MQSRHRPKWPDLRSRGTLHTAEKVEDTLWSFSSTLKVWDFEHSERRIRWQSVRCEECGSVSLAGRAKLGGRLASGLREEPLRVGGRLAAAEAPTHSLTHSLTHSRTHSPHLTSPHLTLTLTSPHLTSPHLTSPSPHLTSPHLTSPHLTSPHSLTHSNCNSNSKSNRKRNGLTGGHPGKRTAARSRRLSPDGFHLQDGNPWGRALFGKKSRGNKIIVVKSLQHLMTLRSSSMTVRWWIIIDMIVFDEVRRRCFPIIFILSLMPTSKE